MATLSLPHLSLDLPRNSSRFSVDFNTLSIDLSAFSPPASGPIKDGYLRNNKPLPPLRQPAQPRASSYKSTLPNVTEESNTNQPSPSPPKWQWSRITADRSTSRGHSSGSLERTHSNASTVSESSTHVTSVFSRAQSRSTERTSVSSSRRPSAILKRSPKDSQYLSSLPLSLLEDILSHALNLPQTISIGPTSSAHMQYRYHPESLEHMEIGKVLSHPIFSISKLIRGVALDLLYRKCEFTIDLASIYYTKVSSTVKDNLKKHQKYWNEPPKIVGASLRSFLRLHIRLPVPSTEAGTRRGRDEDDWMDGSDGKGGGSWRVKSMEREQEDAQRIQKCLDLIIKLIMTTRGETTGPQGLTRSLSNLGSVRRSNSKKRTERSKSAEYDRMKSASSSDTEGNNGKRKPLKRLEITLVKRSSQALILSEALGLIRCLRGLPVTGFTRYYLELQAHRLLWATKYKRRWQGMEPDGSRLLQDLQSLTITEKPFEPIQTPTEFKFVQVDRKTRQLRLMESAMPTTPIVLDGPLCRDDGVPRPPMMLGVPKSTRQKPLGGIFSKMAHKRNDSFGYIVDRGMSDLGSSGTVISGRYEPPTVEELRKIVEDVRAGIY